MNAEWVLLGALFAAFFCGAILGVSVGAGWSGGTRSFATDSGTGKTGESIENEKTNVEAKLD
jgi:hypothetical protein